MYFLCTSYAKKKLKYILYCLAPLATLTLDALQIMGQGHTEQSNHWSILACWWVPSQVPARCCLTMSVWNNDTVIVSEAFPYYLI